MPIRRTGGGGLDERPAGVPTDQLAFYARYARAELDRKLTALRAMATQTSGLMAMLDPATYPLQVAEEGFVDAATLTLTAGTARGGERGRTAGVPR